jgi:hypothetical protein
MLPLRNDCQFLSLRRRKSVARIKRDAYRNLALTSCHYKNELTRSTERQGEPNEQKHSRDVELGRVTESVRAGVAHSEYRLSHGLEKGGSIPGRGNGGISSLRHRIQTDSEAHPASYPMGPEGYKADGA